MMKRERVTFDLSPYCRDKLDDIAKKKGISRSSLIRRILFEKLREYSLSATSKNKEAIE